MLKQKNRGRKFTEQEILDAIHVRHSNKYQYPPFPEKFTVKTRISIICEEHGEFLQSIEHHMKGQGCRKCAHIKINEGNKLGRSKWISRFESVHGKGKYDYSKVPNEVLQKDRIKIYCREHDTVFIQTPVQHWRLKQGCPKCGYAKQWETRRSEAIPRSEFELRARQIHGLKFEYQDLPKEVSPEDTIVIFSNETKKILFCKVREHLSETGK